VANPEETEAAVEQQELNNKEMNLDSVGSMDDRHIWLYGAVDGRRSGYKEIVRSVRSAHGRSGKASLTRGIPKRWTLETRRETSYNGIWNRVSELNSVGVFTLYLLYALHVSAPYQPSSGAYKCIKIKLQFIYCMLCGSTESC
jgi:hypothetical protein